ncbi:hypothetical protein TIFTF001_021389 [Ficus carica]|uniref:Uncharacterized protein n=1 Tax=Ficus carica TaxID=3494 RepID=A0AA88DAQ0_FICCA|nr:hypothetical protein TIFTF001_021389 [Ficus carica]
MSRHDNDTARNGGETDDGVLEPEELPLFQDEQAEGPGLDVVAFLSQPSGIIWLRPELDTVVAFGASLG